MNKKIINTEINWINVNIKPINLDLQYLTYSPNLEQKYRIICPGSLNNKFPADVTHYAMLTPPNTFQGDIVYV